MTSNAFGHGAGALSGAAGARLLLGHKLVAVAIVAQAVWEMARTAITGRYRERVGGIALALAKGMS
jgi:chromate transport protein ChrA